MTHAMEVLSRRLILDNGRRDCFYDTPKIMQHMQGNILYMLDDSADPVVFASGVTRLGDLLGFGQLFKAFGNDSFAQISYILRQIW